MFVKWGNKCTYLIDLLWELDKNFIYKTGSPEPCAHYSLIHKIFLG